MLYDAALDPDLWPTALPALARVLSAPAALLVAGAGDRRTAGVLATTGLQPAAVLACYSIDPAVDPIGEAAERRPGLPVITGYDLSEERLAASEFGRLVLQPAGLAHVMGAARQVDAGGYLALWFFRPASRPFLDTDATVLTEWLPHVARAVAVQQRLSSAESARAAAAAAFDRFALGAVVVDECGRPLIVNRRAERVLAGGDGLSASPNGLCGATGGATARLREAIRSTVAEAAAAGRTRSTGLRLARPSGAAPLEVIVVSLAGAGGAPNARRYAAILFIVDPKRSHVPPERLLRDLYGLTRAEARLAMSLASGRSLTAAAAELGVTRNTAHTQLSSVFAKTGATTQLELVRLLHRGPAAVRSDEDSSDVEIPINPSNRE